MERRRIYDYRDTKVIAQERAITYNNVTGEPYFNQFYVTFKYISQFVSTEQGYKLEKYISGIGWKEYPNVFGSVTRLKSGHSHTLGVTLPMNGIKSDEGVYKVTIVCRNKKGLHYSNTLWMVQDREGNVYNTSVFGEYRITTEPLRTQLDSNNRSIMSEAHWVDINNLSKGIIYTANTASESAEYSGFLKKGLCPECCYIPNDEVLNSIKDYLENNDVSIENYPDMSNNNYVMTCTFPNRGDRYIDQWKLEHSNNTLQLNPYASSTILSVDSPLDALIYCVVTEVSSTPMHINNLETYYMEYDEEYEMWLSDVQCNISIDNSVFSDLGYDEAVDISAYIEKLTSNGWVKVSDDSNPFTIENWNGELNIVNIAFGDVMLECTDNNTLYRLYCYYDTALFGRVKSNSIYIIRDNEGHPYICKQVGNYIISTEYLCTTKTNSGVSLLTNNYKGTNYNYAKLYKNVVNDNMVPIGFHIPTKEEWDEIFIAVGCKNQAIKASPIKINQHKYNACSNIGSMGDHHNAETGISELNLYPLGNWHNNDSHLYNLGEDAPTYLATSSYYNNSIIYAYTLQSTTQTLVPERQLLGQTFAIRFCRRIDNIV